MHFRVSFVFWVEVRVPLDWCGAGESGDGVRFIAAWSYSLSNPSLHGMQSERKGQEQNKDKVLWFIFGSVSNTIDEYPPYSFVLALTENYYVKDLNVERARKRAKIAIKMSK